MSKLAINGAKPLGNAANCRILDWPPVSAATADKLKDLYLSRAWSFNSQTEQEFEKAFADYHTAKYGIFMGNGTVTLECALEALGIGPGDEVIVPGLTWIATAMAVRYVGAKPVFADIAADTFTLAPAAVQAAITPRTKAIIPVHIYGSIADLEQLLALAQKHGLALIEDCAHMQGGQWQNRGVGSWGDIGSFSFQQSKTLASGEGGICLTNDAQLAEKLYRCKHIGYSRYDQQGQAGTPPPPGLTSHNYRGTAFQALLLNEQLPGLNKLLQEYQNFADILKADCCDIPGFRLQSPGRLASRQGYYALGMVFEGEQWESFPLTRILEAIAAEGAVGVGKTYGPVYQHLLFNLQPEEYILPSGSCPVCEKICARALVIKHNAMYYPETARTLAAIIHKVWKNREELKV